MTPLQADPISGLMSGARQIPSPNRDARPAGVVPELIVVHGISLPPGEFGGPWIDRLFTNTLPVDAHSYFAEIAGLIVSSHLCIARDGAVMRIMATCRLRLAPTTYMSPAREKFPLPERIFLASGAERRHMAVDPTVEDVSGGSTAARMERYLVEAMPLGKSAVTGALSAAWTD